MNNMENIYCSVPDEAFVEDKTELNYRKPIKDFLKERKGKFFTAKEIAKVLGYPTRGTQVEVRKAITLLLEIDNEPIASMSKGFAYVDNKEQMNFYADRLQERLLRLQRRIRAMRKVADNMEEL